MQAMITDGIGINSKTHFADVKLATSANPAIIIAKQLIA
jgi:hypothetical protein